jgi:hypothetical protein
MADHTALEERRQRLENRLDTFHAKLDAMLDGVDFADIHANHLQNVDEENDDDWEEDDWEDVDGGGNGGGEQEKSEVVERMTLLLPSYLKPADWERLGFGRVAKLELELRQGQANDSLQDLRIALGHKALLFRTDVSRRHLRLLRL